MNLTGKWIQRMSEQRMGGVSQKRCFLVMTWPWHSWVHGSHAFLHEICTASGLSIFIRDEWGLACPHPFQNDCPQFTIVGGEAVTFFSLVATYKIVLAPMNDFPARVKQTVLIYTWWVHIERRRGGAGWEGWKWERGMREWGRKMTKNHISVWHYCIIKLGENPSKH